MQINSFNSYAFSINNRTKSQNQQAFGEKNPNKTVIVDLPHKKTSRDKLNAERAAILEKVSDEARPLIKTIYAYLDADTKVRSLRLKAVEAYEKLKKLPTGKRPSPEIIQDLRVSLQTVIA